MIRFNPKVGEPFLVGKAYETPEVLNGYGDLMGFGAGTGRRDDQYTDGVWICLAIEEDRIVAKRLVRKGEHPSVFVAGEIRPIMIDTEKYPIMKCGTDTLKVMTGYTFKNNLAGAVMGQTYQTVKERYDEKLSKYYDNDWYKK